MRPITDLRTFLFLLCTIFACPTWAQNADSLFVTQALQEAPPDATTLYFARLFIGRPYVAHTLEVGESEQLVVNTRQLDCTTYVENVLALTLCAAAGRKTYADFTAMLCRLRYRGGRLAGYASRLHYFSDWIDDNAQAGYISEVQHRKAPFTAVQTLKIDFMSRHPSSYKTLTAHPELVPLIAAQEEALTGRSYRYIPKREVKNSKTMRQAVHDGDIIAITTSKPGLDIAHLGFAVWRRDGLHLLNASMIHKKVVEEPMTLEQYLAKHPSHTGLRIIRVNH